MEIINNLLEKKHGVHQRPEGINSWVIPFKQIQLLLVCTLLLAGMPVQGQRDLEPIKDSATSILDELSDSGNKITRVSLTKEDEKSIEVDITFEGFGDKAYKVRGFILDRNKKTIEAINPVEKPMPNSKQLELEFALSDAGSSTNAVYLESKYLQIKVVSDDGGLGSMLEESIEGLNLSGVEFLYGLDKKWMLSGQNVLIDVTLVPYKNAGSISRN